ncbi:MAG: hypothetical protein SFU91_15030 [Chloroherpetonaceae bacterium]|nr:hypothetical protein [Chloroherpetonaceae bacterium]
MNNFYLFKDALNTATLGDFENGIKSLNEVVAKRNTQTDNLIRYEDFWMQSCVHGVFYELPLSLTNEYKGLVVKLFNSFSPIAFDIPNEADFDILYNNDCNGFKGFDFTLTAILPNRQIANLVSFNEFKFNCAKQVAYKSIQNYWDNRDILFPNLIFCDRVLEQIRHLSVNDDRFGLIDQKLKRLNLFTGTWKHGNFDYSNLGLDNSPDTPTRITNSLALRTFNCPGIGDRVFSLHIKWYFGGEPFRLYYFPNNSNRKVYIGYIGPKADIGF